MMLARNAESMFWIGRYVERADDTARILDVAVHQLLEDATVDPDVTCRRMLSVLGLPLPPDGVPLDALALTERLAYADEEGSIRTLVGRARENARSAREITSSEMWACLNTTYNGLDVAERSARRLGPHSFLSYIKNRSAMFAGLADATLSRDDGYRFLLLGRSVERVDMTVRMLLSRAGDRPGSPAWVTVLRSAGAHDTYLRTYRGALDAPRVVEFLLLDRLFPRSVYHAIVEAERSLLALDERPDSRVGARAEAQRVLGRARSELEFLDPGVLLENLPQRLLGLQETCRELSEAVTAQYFYVAPYVTWADARQRGAAARDEAEADL